MHPRAPVPHVCRPRAARSLAGRAMERIVSPLVAPMMLMAAVATYLASRLSISAYPAGYDSFTNPTSATPMNSEVGGRTHSEFHADLNDAVEAGQVKLGVGASPAAAASAGDTLTKQADGTTAWTPSAIFTVTLPAASAAAITLLQTIIDDSAAAGDVIVVTNTAVDLSAARLFNKAGVTVRFAPEAVITIGAFSIVNEDEDGDGIVEGGHFTGSTDLDGEAIAGGVARGVTAAEGTTFKCRDAENFLPDSIAALQYATYPANTHPKAFRVWIDGDSLGAGGGSGDPWDLLLFSNGYDADFFLGSYFPANPTEPPPTYDEHGFYTVDQMAIGGVTPANLGTRVAVERDLVEATINTDTVLEGAVRGLPPVFQRGYHVMIYVDSASSGSGSGYYPLSRLENHVRQIRQQGIEVILVTPAPTLADVDSASETAIVYRKIGEAYGCAVADVNTRVRNMDRLDAAGRGGHPHTFYLDDSVHPNQAGQNEYARAVLGAFLNRGPFRRQGKFPSLNVVRPEDLTLSQNWVTQTVLVPADRNIGTTGSLIVPTPPNYSIRHPLHGRRDLSTACVIQLDADEYVDFACEGAVNVDIILQGSNDATFTVRRGASVLMPTTDGVTTTWALAPGGEDLDAQDSKVPVGCEVAPGSWSGSAVLRNGTVRIRAAVGTANPLVVVGVVFHAPLKEPLPRAVSGESIGARYTGTWASDESPNGLGEMFFTDTVDDHVEFDFVGPCVQVTLPKGIHGGQVQLSVDGMPSGGVIETYSTDLDADKKKVQIRSGFLRHGRHRARLTLVGVNGSATAPSIGTYHRLQPLMMAVLYWAEDARLNDLVPAWTIGQALQGEAGPPGDSGSLIVSETTADTTVANTVAKTALATRATPDDLEAGDRLILRVGGDLLNNKGTTGGITFRIELDGNLIATCAASVGTSASRRRWWFEVVLAVVDINDQKFSGLAFIGHASANSAFASSANVQTAAIKGVGTVDLTTTKNLVLNVEMDAADAAFEVVATQSSLEHLQKV